MLKFKLYRLSVPLQHLAVALILVGLQIGTYLGNSVQISLNVGLRIVLISLMDIFILRFFDLKSVPYRMVYLTAIF